MGLGNKLLLSQATGYTVTFLLSLCVVVPLSINTKNFRGHCLLYTTGYFDNDGGYLRASWASSSYCSFVLFVGVMMMVMSVIQVVRFSVFLFKGVDSSFLSAFLDTVINLLVTGFIFVASVIVTGGLHTWCNTVMQRFPSCDDAELLQIDEKDGIDTFGFYIQMGTVQFGSWSSWVCWVLLTVLSTRKLCRYHQEENIRISMARERRRLLDPSQCPSYTNPAMPF